MQMRPPPAQFSPRFVVALLAAGLASGLALASWVAYGPGIFMALVQSGLSWCF